MSSNLPPVGPPPPPPPPPWQPGPEFLDSGSGGPVPPPSSGKGGRRTGLIAGGAVVGLAAVGTGGYFAWAAFFGTGAQPAEALPDSTVGYVSIDLDPSGQQKLEALEALNKFPGFDDNVDLETDDDLRQKLFEYVQDSEGACPDLDYGDDIEPWLGDRFAIAAVDLGGDAEEGGLPVTPVGVIQVTDAAKAEDGLEKIRGCASDADDVGGWSIEGDWIVIAETEELAQQVTDAAAENPLSDDESFQKWTDAAGDPGILTAYAAPEVGELVADAFGGFPLGGGLEDFEDFEAEAEASADQITQVFEGFEGAAVTVRFDDGGLEVESASSVDYLGLSKIYGSDRGDDVVATLPEDTAVAFGVGFEEGWFTELTDYVGTFSGDAFDIEAGLAEIEAMTGLSLPEDAETLAGSSAAIALGPDFDPDAFSEDDPSGLPLGVKVQGDPEAITTVIDKLLAGASVPPELKDEFGYQTSDDYVVAGFSDGFTEQLLDDGQLGDTDAYQDVVRESEDASSVFYVNFDAGNWLVEVAGGDEEVEQNLEPLSGLGLSGWTDDEVSHSLLRITTD